MNFRWFFQKHKYVILLIALLQHLYIGIFVQDMELYTRFLFPVNMIILGIASTGVFIEKGIWKKTIKNILSTLVIFFPLSVPIFGNNPTYMLLLNGSFCLFYSFILWEVLRFLVRPSYINQDVMVGSACGYFLMIEIMVFLLQGFYYSNPSSFKGIDNVFSIEHSATIFTDLVYFSTITITSIGFGDITPNTHFTKLITSLFGVMGQFYSVVLVGIIISKFTSNQP